MREYLLQNGYTLGNFPNEWIKETWTIRLTESYIEAFQNLENKNEDKYILWPKDLKGLIFILTEIDKL